MSWNFSKTPVIAPDWANRPEAPLPVTAPFLPSAIQQKLAIGDVNDPLEHEANRVAKQVMCMPDPELPIEAIPPLVSRKCAACEEEEAKALQPKPVGAAKAAAGEAPGIVHDVLRSSGQPLDGATRAVMECHFGHDFSQVRVHSSIDAALSAQALNAHAYTVGSHIVFGSGRFAPGSQDGRRLLAHELAHVVQQSAAPTQTKQLQRQNGGDGASDMAPAQAETSGPQKELAEMVATLRDAIASQGVDPSADPEPTAAPNTKAGLLQTLAILEALLATGTPEKQQAVIDSIHQASSTAGSKPMAQQKSVSISNPGDPLEQEADAAAESVLSRVAYVPRLSRVPVDGPALTVQRQTVPWPLVECGPVCWAILAAIVLAEGAAYISTRKKTSACSCVCYARGVGPNPLGQRPSPWQCQQDCLTAGYNGYKCGGDVTWE